MPDTRAALTMAPDGGDTRFSISTDSMAEVGALMVMVSWVQCKIGRYCRTRYLQATDAAYRQCRGAGTRLPQSDHARTHRSVAQGAWRIPYRAVLASDPTPRWASMASADRQMIGDATLGPCQGFDEAGRAFHRHGHPAGACWSVQSAHPGLGGRCDLLGGPATSRRPSFGCARPRLASAVPLASMAPARLLLPSTDQGIPFVVYP